MKNTRIKSICAVPTLACLAFVSVTSFTGAQNLDIPIIELADSDLDTCVFGKVTGLDPQGDGFLAVRSGPGTKYRKLDEIHNEDYVWIFNWEGNWMGIVYDNDDLSCGPISANREVPYKGKKGWVHKKWIEMIAG